MRWLVLAVARVVRNQAEVRAYGEVALAGPLGAQERAHEARALQDLAKQQHLSAAQARQGLALVDAGHPVGSRLAELYAQLAGGVRGPAGVLEIQEGGESFTPSDVAALAAVELGGGVGIVAQFDACIERPLAARALVDLAKLVLAPPAAADPPDPPSGGEADVDPLSPQGVRALLALPCSTQYDELLRSTGTWRELHRDGIVSSDELRRSFVEIANGVKQLPGRAGDTDERGACACRYPIGDVFGDTEELWRLAQLQCNALFEDRDHGLAVRPFVHRPRGCAARFCCKQDRRGRDRAVFVPRDVVGQLRALDDQYFSTLFELSAELLWAERAVSTVVSAESAYSRMEQEVLQMAFYLHDRQVRRLYERVDHCCLYSRKEGEVLDVGCVDPWAMKSQLGFYQGQVVKLSALFRGLVSCMAYGYRPLAEEATLLGKVMNLGRRLFFFGRGLDVVGHVKEGVRFLWKHRLELMLASMAAMNLEKALSLTAMTISSSSSLPVVFGSLVRAIGANVLCPLLLDPITLGMIARWLMRNVVLTDWFFSVVIGPLWPLFQVSLKLPLEILESMLVRLRDYVRGQKHAPVDRATFLEALRGFHDSALADALYVWLFGQLGVVITLLREGICDAASATTVVVNLADSAINGTSNVVSRTAKRAMNNVMNWWNLFTGDKALAQARSRMMQEEAWAREAQAEYALTARLLRGLHTSIFKLVQGRNWVQDKAILVATTVLDLLSQSSVLGGAVSLVVGRHLLAYYTRVLPATAPATQAAHGHLRYLIQQDAEDFARSSCAAVRGRTAFKFAEDGTSCTLLRDGELGRGQCCDGACREPGEGDDPCASHYDTAGRTMAASFREASSLRMLIAENDQVEALVRSVRQAVGCPAPDEELFDRRHLHAEHRRAAALEQFVPSSLLPSKPAGGFGALHEPAAAATVRGVPVPTSARATQAHAGPIPVLNLLDLSALEDHLEQYPDEAADREDLEDLEGREDLEDLEGREDLEDLEGRDEREPWYARAWRVLGEMTDEMGPI